jgi:hypothetical protein
MAEKGEGPFRTEPQVADKIVQKSSEGDIRCFPDPVRPPRKLQGINSNVRRKLAMPGSEYRCTCTSIRETEKFKRRRWIRLYYQPPWIIVSTFFDWVDHPQISVRTS